MAMAVRVKGLATAASVVSRVVHQNDCVDTNMMRVLNMCKRSERPTYKLGLPLFLHHKAFSAAYACDQPNRDSDRAPSRFVNIR